MEEYFTITLPNRNPTGQFNMPKGKLSRTGKMALFEGEILFLSWKGKILRVARAGSGVIEPPEPTPEATSYGDVRYYEFYFIIDLDTLRKPAIKLTLKDLDEILPPLVGGEIKRISGTQGWNWAPETEELEDWFDSI